MENQLLNVLGEKLYVSDSTSVQPNVLLRTPIFTPVNKHGSRHSGAELTESFRNLELFKQEGYESVYIEGLKLNVQTDFKVWCGIVFAFSKYGYKTESIQLKFTEFVKLCGYKSRRINKNLRQQVEGALERIQSQSLRFRTKDAKKSINTSLLLKSQYDTETDTITLMGDSSLWEVYRIDHQILVSFNVLNKIPRAETAQCLYLFMTGLPKNPIPITLSRMRDRLCLNMSVKEMNRSIRTAIKKLESIGYITGTWVKFNGESAYNVHSRDTELISNNSKK